MEPEGMLLCSQDPATGSYPEEDEFSPHTTPHLYEINFNSILPSMTWSPKWYFPSYVSTKILRAFLSYPMLHDPPI
jgi:hypothetical protein